MDRWSAGLAIPLMVLCLLLAGAPPAPAAAGEKAPVLLGLDAEFGHRSSTSDDAIRAGIRIAMAEINAAGGVLGGRPLKLLERDNRSVPARGIRNLEEFAKETDMVAVFCGKFSPVVIEQLPTIHRLGMIMLDPWAAGDPVIDNDYSPNYVFRLSLRDGWAMPVILRHARRMGAERVGMLIANTAWGRSNAAAANRYVAAHPETVITSAQWYNWGDKSLMRQYQQLRQSGAQAVILIANEAEGSLLVREMAALPPEARLPVLSHWGVSGGAFVEMAGDALDQVDFSVVQTYSFLDDAGPDVERVVAAAEAELGVRGAGAIPSPVGLAHAYDLTHILARAIDAAGTTGRAQVRDALEHLGAYDGLIRRYDPPFTPERHEALDLSRVFMARFQRDGRIVPIPGSRFDDP